MSTEPAAAPVPPERMIAAAEEAMAERFVAWNMQVAPAALRILAIDAINAARAASLTRMHGARHG